MRERNEKRKRKLGTAETPRPTKRKRVMPTQQPKRRDKRAQDRSQRQHTRSNQSIAPKQRAENQNHALYTDVQMKHITVHARGEPSQNAPTSPRLPVKQFTRAPSITNATY